MLEPSRRYRVFNDTRGHMPDTCLYGIYANVCARPGVSLRRVGTALSRGSAPVPYRSYYEHTIHYDILVIASRRGTLVMNRSPWNTYGFATLVVWCLPADSAAEYAE